MKEVEFHDTILLIDKDKTLCLLLKSILEKDGYNVEIALDGYSGRNLLETRKPSCVLLDLDLPDDSGLEIIRWVRGFSCVPLVVLAALKGEGEKNAAFESGADDFVEKPFGSMELLARIRAALRRTRKEYTSREFASGTTFEIGDLKVDFLRAEYFLTVKISEFLPENISFYRYLPKEPVRL